MRTVDLFAGCGGLSLGFQNAGFDIVAAFELWEVAANCYEKNFSHPVIRADLSKTDEAIALICFIEDLFDHIRQLLIE